MLAALLQMIVIAATALQVTTVSANSSEQAASVSWLERDDVKQWIQQTVSETALETDYIAAQLSLAKRSQKVIDRISRPAEKTLNWGEYRAIFLKQNRIDAGREFIREHADLLASAESRFGVPGEVIAAIIGIETFYGRYKGRDHALSALATLAFDYPPRESFFKRELREFLLLAKEESFNPSEIHGSYAAAMGMPQFISSSYRHYAIDFDDDGRRDLWDSKADVIGSVANYLNQHGWVSDEPIAERVRSKNEGGAYKTLLSSKLKPGLRRKQLRAAGIYTNGYSTKEKSLMQLVKGKESQLWVGFQNFYAITRYNHSKLYAMAVYELSNTIKTAVR